MLMKRFHKIAYIYPRNFFIIFFCDCIYPLQSSPLRDYGSGINIQTHYLWSIYSIFNFSKTNANVLLVGGCYEVFEFVTLVCLIKFNQNPI